ncbi:MAG: hypothetical protein JRN68_05260 [Nitrososphaerota archaeon]|nr:hypothetical protein [Nitrososphaerota archaeon]
MLPAITRLSVASFILVLAEVAVYAYPNYDLSTFVLGVLSPVSAGIILMWKPAYRVALYSYLAIYFSLADDAPIFLDSVLTWPEVTRYHPFLPHLSLEITLHLLTGVFIYLALKEVAPRIRWLSFRGVASILLGFFALVFCYAQNLPVQWIQLIVEKDWYTLDVVEHMIAILFLLSGLMVARSSDINQNGLKDR